MSTSEEKSEKKALKVPDDRAAPSALGLAAAGSEKKDPSDEELAERAARYQEAKKRARWG